MNLKNRYRLSLIAFSLYTSYQCYQGLKLHRLIASVRDLAQAQNLLSVDGFWLLERFKIVFENARSVGDVLMLLPRLVSPSYVILTSVMIILFYQRPPFKIIVAMVLIPWVCTALMIVPLIQGIVTLHVGQTIQNVGLMAWFGIAIYLLGLLVSLIYAVLIGCDFVEVGATFNYNEGERGDCDVRNDE